MEPATSISARLLVLRRLSLVLVVAVLVVAALTTGLPDKLTAVVGYVRSAGPVTFFVAMALLPLVGIPLMPFTVAAGPAFGPVLGIGPVILWAIVAVGVNVALSYALAAHVLRPSISRLAAFLGYRIPAASGSWHVSALIRLAPGLPFFAQSYVLGVMRVPFGSYMLVSTLVPAGYISGVILLGDALWKGEGRAMFFALSLLVLAGTALHFLRQRHLASLPTKDRMAASDAPGGP